MEKMILFFLKMLNLISYLKKSGLKKILLPVDPTIRPDTE